MRDAFVVKWIAIAVAFMVLLAVACVIAAQPSFKEKDYQVVSVTVAPGDTLSQLAYKYKADTCDWREWSAAVQRLNNIDANLLAGEVIWVYAYEK